MSFPKSSDHSVLAVIFDWAGTTVDYGSLAPVAAIYELFRRAGVSLSDAQIRKDMGLHKREHIRSILLDQDVQKLWIQARGKHSAGEDVERLFAEMLDTQLAVMEEHSGVLPGILETVGGLRQRGIKIGSTTGYTREMMKALTRYTAQQGYQPDCLVCPEDVGAGRPYPWMIYEVSRQLSTFPLWRCVKVGDTVSDIEEGRNAGTWTVGVTRTGNLAGLSEAAWAELGDQEKEQTLDAASKQFREAGADFVIESAADLLPTIVRIEERLRSGEKPDPSFVPSHSKA